MSSPILSSPVPKDVLIRWARFAGAKLRPIETGLINLTFELQTASEKAILQRLHPVFPVTVNLDIAVVTAHLAQQGLVTPQLLPADDGALWVEANGIWRMLSFVSGRNYTALANPAMALEAGRLVGRFHTAMASLNYQYQSTRSNVHDTTAHLQRLAAVLTTHGTHRLYDSVAKAAQPLLQAAQTIATFVNLPLRFAHGDLKISNLIFDQTGAGLALIDLDTLTVMHWPLEMGDALRSWCNPRREDQRPAQLDLALLQAAVTGYKEAAPELITAAEWAALIPGLARICLELSARFFADALSESYFGWDAARYPARGEHNLARGADMWDLYQDVMAKQEAAQLLIQGVRLG